MGPPSYISGPALTETSLRGAYLYNPCNNLTTFKLQLFSNPIYQ